jgi:mycoredoxin
MTATLTMFGATNCDDTKRSRLYMQTNQIAFRDINIDHDVEAERFVIFINGGNRNTPTLVLSNGKYRFAVTEPTDDELKAWLAQNGG